MANIPTTAEAGLPGFTVQPWLGIYMSGKTPAALQRQVIDAVAPFWPPWPASPANDRCVTRRARPIAWR